MVTNKKTTSKSNIDSNPDAVLSELKAVKQLLVILLAKLGSDSREIGDAIGVEPRRVREWISFNGIRRISGPVDKKTDKGLKQASEKVIAEEEKGKLLAPEEVDINR